MIAVVEKFAGKINTKNIMGLTQELVAENLLWGLWRSITEDYKCQYPREIWEHFENALRSASYTDSLKVFLTNFQRRIPIDIQAQFNKDILSVVEAGEDDKVLNWLRSSVRMIAIVLLMAYLIKLK